LELKETDIESLGAPLKRRISEGYKKEPDDVVTSSGSFRFLLSTAAFKPNGFTNLALEIATEIR
jgi:hypothetical protein